MAQTSAQQTSATQKIGFWLLAAFLFLLYGRLADFFLPYLHIPLIVSSTCFLLLLLNGTLPAVLKSRQGKLLIAFSIWLCFAVPWSFWPGGSFQMLSDEWLRSFAVFLTVAGLVVTLNQLLKLMSVLAWTFLLAAVLALVLGVNDSQGRLTFPVGLYSGPNEVAMAMLTGCVYWWWMVYKPPRSLSRRFLSLLCLLPLLYVLPRTASRGALVAALLIVPFLVLRSATRGKIVVLTVVMATLFAFAAFLPDQIKARFETLFPQDATQSADSQDASTQESAMTSTQERLYLLKTSTILTLTHPILGVGPGEFEVAENDRAVNLGLPKGNWHGTHNTYTQISSEAGIPALVFFVSCMWFCWKELIQIEKRAKDHPHPRAEEISMTAFALRAILFTDAIFFMFVHLGYAPFFPTLAGLVVAFSRIAKAQLKDEAGEPPDRRGVHTVPAVVGS
jgi:O-antigen ligase